MKKNLTIILCLLTVSMFSQNFNWNKEKKNGVYLECISDLEKYQLADITVKENICLCFLNKVMEKYSFQEYSNKIDVAKRRFIHNNITSCASNYDVSLQKNNLSIEGLEREDSEISLDEINEEDIIGVWSFEKGTFSFYQDNEYKYEGKTGKCRGKWTVTGSFLDIDSKLCSDEKFELIKIEDEAIIMYRIRGRKLFHLKRQK